ncbi:MULTISPECIES: hypothetical protein [unclassified Bartonella]
MCNGAGLLLDKKRKDDARRVQWGCYYYSRALLRSGLGCFRDVF